MMLVFYLYFLQLNLYGCSDLTADLPTLLIHCPLKHLNLSLINSLTDQSILILSQIRTLQSINLYNCSQISAAGLAGKYIVLCSSFNPVAVVLMLLTDCLWLFDLVFLALFDSCPNLFSVGLYGLSRLSYGDLRVLLQRGKSLRKIDVGG